MTLPLGFDMVPYILFLSSLYLLRSKLTLFTFYIVGYLFNELLNFLLKILIKQPRPSEDPSLFYAMIEAGKTVEHSKLGMPSGHMQSCFYSICYIYLVHQEYYFVVTLMFLLFTIYTGYMCVKENRHTLLQVVFGSIIGLFIGNFFYTIATKKMMGLLHFKIDDNAPV